MIKIFGLIALVLGNNLAFAQKKSPVYQIDLIVFTQEQTSAKKEISLTHFANDKAKIIRLNGERTEARTPYHLLPSSFSQLKQEYRALSSKPQYRVMLHYSWLQPESSKATIQLPKINQEGWEIKGRIRIRQTNYYLLDSELKFTALNEEKSSFSFTEKQQLKGGDIYYLDHPQAGMLIKVHPVA